MAMAFASEGLNLADQGLERTGHADCVLGGGPVDGIMDLLDVVLLGADP
jgi:hypothetical protein